MKPALLAVLAFTWLTLAPASQAEQRTATFTVDKMFCAMCPITVRIAMEKVDGVAAVEVDLDSKSATVVYDSSVVTPERIAEAAAHAGYPAEQKM